MTSFQRKLNHERLVRWDKMWAEKTHWPSEDSKKRSRCSASYAKVVTIDGGMACSRLDDPTEEHTTTI